MILVSAAFLPYHLRINKSIERSIFMDFLVKLHSKVPISSYQYIGFGAIHMEDFKLLHSLFGIQNMTSLEYDENAYKRQKFNKPLSCIKLLNLSSGEFIRNHFNPSDSDNSIIWLDFADTNIGDQIYEYRELISKLGENDVIKITLNANPSTLQAQKNEYADIDKVRKKRIEVLKEKLGDFFPVDTEPKMMTHKQYPNVLLKALQLATESAFIAEDDLRLSPVSSFIYKDLAHQMLTFTAIILRESSTLLNDISISNWEYKNLNWSNPLSINVPDLTLQERVKLDSYLPVEKTESINSIFNFYFTNKKEEHIEMLENYSKYYRHYPYFSKVTF